jgi:hypothetical protein
LPEITTAQRLAAYRDELLNAGFTPAQTWELLVRVAPDQHDDIKIQDDLTDPQRPAAELHLRLTFTADEESLAHIANTLRARAQAALHGGPDA